MARVKITNAAAAAPVVPVEAPAPPVAEDAPVAPPVAEVVVDAPAAAASDASDVLNASDAAAAPAAAAAAAAAPLTTAEKVAALAKLLDASFITAKDTVNKFKQALKEVAQIQKEVTQLEKEKGRKNKGRAAKAAAAAALASGTEGGADAVVVTRKPSGFATPAILSAQLSEFLGLPEGSKMARTEVTRLITDYVKANKLHDSADKRIIHMDDKLKQILGGGSDTDNKPLTYFNLQTHIKRHFIKNTPAVANTGNTAEAPVAIAV